MIVLTVLAIFIFYVANTISEDHNIVIIMIVLTVLVIFIFYVANNITNGMADFMLQIKHLWKSYYSTVADKYNAATLSRPIIKPKSLCIYYSPTRGTLVITWYVPI